MRLLACFVLAATLASASAVGQTPPPAPPPRQSPVPPVRRLPPNVLTQPAAPTCGYRDCDSDGHAALSDAGDDCDDRDPNRYPGNTEIADAGVDQDCNPGTFGARDQDHDGFVDIGVYNIDPSALGTVGERVGGDDCDDRQAQIRPNSQELPNHIDDNCDGLIDNLIGDWYLPPPRH